jgi:hypothetical protein
MDDRYKVKEMIVVHKARVFTRLPPPKLLKHTATLSTIQQVQILFGVPLITDIVNRVSESEIRASQWSPPRRRQPQHLYSSSDLIVNMISVKRLMKMKCMTCEVKLNDELDVVYGLYDYDENSDKEEKVFCCRNCRDSYIVDHRKV